ncbi:hypothetical protein [Hanstruepera marina]|uniref:hypothetical protein n=1 Tax=Hanstruepera marina TaxID=2873265 RepID=UPI001CA695F2|nr:hypothetical protein [Hanstruepera marina]
MTTEKILKKNYTNKKIKNTRRINMLFIALMSIIVLYDSFIYALPFYYIVFFFFGVFIGHFVSYTETILVLENENIMTLKVNRLGIVIKVLLLILRFYIGKIILLKLSVVWITDALYLFFIGIYFSKLKGLSKQINEQFFKFLYKN